ncbi:hypothetical protein, partial [Nonomuraea angiospora]
PTTAPTSAPTQPSGDAPAVNAGVGVAPAGAEVGQQVRVTAVCGGSKVRDVTSNAFATVRTRPAAPAATWSSALKAVKAGRFGVTVRCENGGVARTALTVG